MLDSPAITKPNGTCTYAHWIILNWIHGRWETELKFTSFSTKMVPIGWVESWDQLFRLALGDLRFPSRQRIISLQSVRLFSHPQTTFALRVSVGEAKQFI